MTKARSIRGDAVLVTTVTREHWSVSHHNSTLMQIHGFGLEIGRARTFGIAPRSNHSASRLGCSVVEVLAKSTVNSILGSVGSRLTVSSILRSVSSRLVETVAPLVTVGTIIAKGLETAF